MNRIKRVVSIIIISLLVLCAVAGCSGKDYAIKIGDVKVTPEQYKAAAISIKTQFLNENGLEESEDLWTQYVDTSYTSTTQEYLDAMIQSYLIEYNLYAIHFDELGLTIPEAKEAEIQKSIDDMIKQQGSREKLEENLKANGFTYDEYVNQYYNEAKKDQVILYYFGPDSTQNPTSRAEMEKYYNEYYTKVKHVFLSTKDSNTNDLSIPQKAEVKKKAEGILARAKKGEDFDALIKEYNEDPGMATNPDGYVFSTEDTSYNRQFYNAAFEMKFGEVRLVQTNLGFHIMKRYEFYTEELSDPETEITLIENMMSSEVANILEGLKERIGVEYNNSVLTNLSAPNIKVDTNKTEDTTTTATK